MTTTRNSPFTRRFSRGFIQHYFFGGQKSGAGFTLVEILVVVGLFALLMTMGTIISFDSISRSTVHNERDLVVLMLTGARARALANVNQSAQGVRIESDKITLFELVGGLPPETNQRITPRDSAIIVSPNPATVIFEQLSANITTGAGMITLTQGPKTDTIDINVEGRIEW